jgi:hypothetical protein
MAPFSLRQVIAGAALLAPAVVMSSMVPKHDIKGIVDKLSAHEMKREITVPDRLSSGDKGVGVYAVVYGDNVCTEGNESFALLYVESTYYGPTDTCLYDPTTGYPPLSYSCDATSVVMNYFDASDTTCSKPTMTYQLFALNDYVSGCMSNNIMYCALKDAVSESNVDATMTTYDYTYNMDDFDYENYVDPDYKCTNGTSVVAIEGLFQSYYSCEPDGSGESAILNICQDDAKTVGEAVYESSSTCSGTPDVYVEMDGGCTDLAMVYECV